MTTSNEIKSSRNALEGLQNTIDDALGSFKKLLLLSKEPGDLCDFPRKEKVSTACGLEHEASEEEKQ